MVQDRKVAGDDSFVVESFIRFGMLQHLNAVVDAVDPRICLEFVEKPLNVLFLIKN